MGNFSDTMGTIAAAMSNKPAPAAPKAPGDFVRSTVGTSGIDTALSTHADEKHPVGQKRKAVYGADWD